MSTTSSFEFTQFFLLFDSHAAFSTSSKMICSEMLRMKGETSLVHHDLLSCLTTVESRFEIFIDFSSSILRFTGVSFICHPYNNNLEMWELWTLLKVVEFNRLKGYKKGFQTYRKKSLRGIEWESIWWEWFYFLQSRERRRPWNVRLIDRMLWPSWCSCFIEIFVVNCRCWQTIMRIEMTSIENISQTDSSPHLFFHRNCTDEQ